MTSPAAIWFATESGRSLITSDMQKGFRQGSLPEKEIIDDHEYHGQDEDQPAVGCLAVAGSCRAFPSHLNAVAQSLLIIIPACFIGGLQPLFTLFLSGIVIQGSIIELLILWRFKKGYGHRFKR